MGFTTPHREDSGVQATCRQVTVTSRDALASSSFASLSDAGHITTLSVSTLIASEGAKMDELGKIWKELFLEGLRNTTTEHSAVGVPIEIRTKHYPNTSPEHCLRQVRTASVEMEPRRPDRLWGTPSGITWGSTPQYQGDSVVGLTGHPSLVPRSRIRGDVPPLLTAPSWRCAY